MKKTKEILTDKKGAGLQLILGFVLIFLLLSIPIYCFAESMMRIVHIKETSQNSIDVYTIKTGKDIMKSVKSGHDYTKDLNTERFLSDLQSQLELKNRYKGHDYKNDFIYQIKDLDVKFIFDKQLKTEVTYTIVYQYYFMSQPLIQNEINVKQESRYNLK